MPTWLIILLSSLILISILCCFSSNRQLRKTGIQLIAGMAGVVVTVLAMTFIVKPIFIWFFNLL